MKYETPETRVIAAAISAIQGMGGGKRPNYPVPEGLKENEELAAYQDWE